MYRAVMAIFAVVFVCGCAPTPKSLSGQPEYSKHFENQVTRESIIVYGELQRNVLSKPTAVFGSAFGHAFCMNEEVTFEVKRYLVGTGPQIINFSNNIIDDCRPIADSTGFGEAILLLNKNEHRGVWSSGSAKVRYIDDKPGIYLPHEIMQFIWFKVFFDSLEDYSEPITMRTDHWLVLEGELERLAEAGVLTFKPDPKNEDGHLVELRKYISLEKLLKNNP